MTTAKRSLGALYGLKFNPFSSQTPADLLVSTAAVDEFCWRVQHQIPEGGFSHIWGAPGAGKSAALRILRSRLQLLPDVCCRVLTRPQAHMADFYRELGHLFDVALTPHNRWAGANVLRTRWLAHMDSSLTRPVLLVDEAQEMHAAVLAELRLLTSAELDAHNIISVVLAGDDRLRANLESPELLPVASRIRIKLHLEPASHDELLHCMQQLLARAGNESLFTTQVLHALCEHALGNYRTLMHLANDLLTVALQRDANSIDEKLFHEVFARKTQPAGRRKV